MKNDNFDRSDRREKHFNSAFLLVVFDNEKIDNVVELRFYQTPAITTCALWINHKPFATGRSTYPDRSGQRSHAFMDALCKVANFNLDDELAWEPNDRYIESVFKKIAEKFDCKFYKVIEVHA